jgi:hypothetical protein
MKYTRPTILPPSATKQMVASIGICALFLTALQREALGQWTQASGIGNMYIGCLAAAGNNVVACGGVKEPDSIFISTDNGNSWSVACTNVPTVVTSIVNVGTGFIVGSDRPGGSYYSTNFGSTWNPNTLDFPNPITSDYSISSLAVVGTTIFAATGSGVYQQAAPGDAWTPDTVGMPFDGGGGEVPPVNSLYLSGSLCFAGAQYTGAYCSTNSGTSWFPINNGLLASYYYGTTVDDFTALGSTRFAAVLDTDQIHTDIYSTGNSGTSWSNVTHQPQDWGRVYGFISGGSNLFIASDSGVYYSMNNGADWIQSNQGLPASSVKEPYIISMDTSGPNLVIGTFANGVWTQKLSNFGNSSVSPNANGSSNAGLGLTISENPASNSGTKVVFTLNDGGFAQVLVMDELGRTVLMLQNGFAAAGQNEVAIDPLTLEPGTYFVRVMANGMSAMQKLVITR